MIADVLLFLLGVGLLVGGAWLLVAGGSRLAAQLGVAPVVIGLTVVAFGTSAPELFVSLVAALRGAGDLMLGNVVGSNVANIGLITGAAALVSPVKIDRGLARREVPLLLGATGLFTLFCWNLRLGRLEGLGLIVVFAGFMILTLSSARHRRPAVLPGMREAAAVGGAKQRGSTILSGLLVLLGIAGLAGGGHFIVASAVRVAARLGASEAFIGLTLVAIGTSLPELATSLLASVRQEGGIALGNVVGSNLFNLLAVAGPVALIRPVSAQASLRTHELPGMILLTLMLPLLLVGKERIGRAWGAALLTLYAAVMFWWYSASV